MMRESTRVSAEAGLEMNVSKTKYMSNRSTEHRKVDNVEIERVVEYTYFGRIISFEQGLHKEFTGKEALDQFKIRLQQQNVFI